MAAGQAGRRRYGDRDQAEPAGALDARSTHGKEGSGFKSLGNPWADTTSPLLTVLSGVAKFEPSLILQRTSEARARALAEGTRFGRKPKLPGIGAQRRRTSTR